MSVFFPGIPLIYFGFAKVIEQESSSTLKTGIQYLPVLSMQTTSQLEDRINKLISSINNCDILILLCPLYVDSAPAIVTKAMELISNKRKSQEHIKRPRMLAICNSGFPEAHQNYTALEIYRHFANESGFEWVGGLALGGGGAIDSRPINSLGGMVRNIIKSLDLIASAIAGGKHIPEEATKLMAKPIVPHWLYFLIGQFGWKIQAKKYGVYRNLNDRPYEVK